MRNTEMNCARLNGPQMSSLRRMNSTRKRSVPASTAHQPISSPGRTPSRRRHSQIVTAPITRNS